MALKMHAGKKQSRRMIGGMTTGQWGSAVYGASNSQQAVGAGSNVIRMNDPNAVQMNGGGVIDDIAESFQGMMPGSATPAPAPAADEKSEGGILSNLNPFASNDASTETPVETPSAAPAMGGKSKSKRKSATKRRKSHKKKGKSSKKRAHKRR